MAGNLTPPSRAYMRVAKSGPSAMGLNDDSSSDDDETPQLPSSNSSTQPRPIPRSAVSYLYPSNSCIAILNIIVEIE